MVEDHRSLFDVVLHVVVRGRRWRLAFLHGQQASVSDRHLELLLFLQRVWILIVLRGWRHALALEVIMVVFVVHIFRDQKSV